MQTAINRHSSNDNVIPIRKPSLTAAGTPRRDRGLDAVVSAASSPSSLAGILVTLVESQRHNKNRPDTIDYTRKKASWLLEFFPPGKDCNSFTPDDIMRYVVKRRSDIVIGGFAPKPIRNIAHRTKEAKKLIAEGKSERRAARVVGIPLHRLRLELRPRPTKCVGDATIKKEVDVLIQALRLARKNSLYHGDHKVLRHDARELPGPKDRALTHAEHASLQTTIRSDRKDWLLTFVRTGCRYGELHRITALDLDHTNFRCQLTGYKGRKKLKELKRWVPLAPDIYEALSALAAAIPEGPLFPHLKGCPVVNAKRRKTGKEVVCTCQSDFHRILRIGTHKAGIPMVTPNDLRRTYCSWMARAGTSEAVMKKFMGYTGESQLITRVYLQLQVDEGHNEVAKLVAEGQKAVANLPGLGAGPKTAAAPRGRRVVRKR